LYGPSFCSSNEGKFSPSVVPPKRPVRKIHSTEPTVAPEVVLKVAGPTIAPSIVLFPCPVTASFSNKSELLEDDYPDDDGPGQAQKLFHGLPQSIRYCFPRQKFATPGNFKHEFENVHRRLQLYPSFAPTRPFSWFLSLYRVVLVLSVE